MTKRLFSLSNVAEGDYMALRNEAYYNRTFEVINDEPRYKASDAYQVVLEAPLSLAELKDKLLSVCDYPGSIIVKEIKNGK